MEELLNTDFLRTRLRGLPASGRLAFLLSCAERLYPNYVEFSRYHGWGDPKALQQAIELGWTSLAKEVIPRTEVEECLARVEAVTPSTEDFDSEFVSPALDAAVCCASVLEFLLTGDLEKIVEGAVLARDTVDMFVQEREKFDAQDPLLESKITRHPLMQQELSRQRTDLDLLSRANWVSSEVVADLARRWRRPAMSNIGLPRLK